MDQISLESKLKTFECWSRTQKI